jgi:hypothetical protein
MNIVTYTEIASMFGAYWFGIYTRYGWSEGTDITVDVNLFITQIKKV